MVNDWDDDRPGPEIPEVLADGDVLVYMSGRLLVVDHLVPESFTIDLVELQAREADSAWERGD